VEVALIVQDEGEIVQPPGGLEVARTQASLQDAKCAFVQAASAL